MFFFVIQKMGLSGPRQKQRIGNDPRNLNWKQDKEAVGFKLLSKMGWAEGSGLGAQGNGMQDFVKVSLKENQYGVGADARTSDNWLENTFAFDSLLQDLKDDITVDLPETSAEPVVMGYRHSHRAKFVRNKVVSNYDTVQINNIFGRTRKGVTEGTKEEEKVIKVENHIVDGVKTVKQNLGIQDYFAKKMAERGIKIGLCGVESVPITRLPELNAQLDHSPVTPTENVKHDSEIVKKKSKKSKSKVSKKSKKSKKSSK
jgi:Pin2-interacting protein X1